MRLLQSGPEQNAAGEPSEKLIRESDDLDVLKAEGLEIAKQLGATDALWVWGPSKTHHSLEVIHEGCYLTIRP